MKEKQRPKEHPTFHRNSMLGSCLLVGLVFLFGGISIHFENQSEESPIPGWVIVSLIVLFFGWFFYRALLARPRCPECRSRDVEFRSDFNADLDGSGTLQQWRRFRCRSCEKEFLLPGMGSDG